MKRFKMNTENLDYLVAMYGDEYIAHHGVQGQQWGKRHGPPYPLTAQARRATEHQLEKNKQIVKASKDKDERRKAKSEIRAARKDIRYNERAAKAETRAAESAQKLKDKAEKERVKALNKESRYTRKLGVSRDEMSDDAKNYLDLKTGRKKMEQFSNKDLAQMEERAKREDRFAEKMQPKGQKFLINVVSNPKTLKTAQSIFNAAYEYKSHQEKADEFSRRAAKTEHDYAREVQMTGKENADKQFQSTKDQMRNESDKLSREQSRITGDMTKALSGIATDVLLPAVISTVINNQDNKKNKDNN